MLMCRNGTVWAGVNCVRAQWNGEPVGIFALGEQMSERLNRRDFLKLGVAAGAGGVVLGNKGLDVQIGRRPNIILIQSDQHRGTIMNCAGDSQAITPNFDRLAREGAHFTRCVSSSPVCSPTRGTYQTGLYPHTHGVTSNNKLLDPNFTSIAEIFASKGYATGLIGKWHLDGFVPADGVGGYIGPGPRRQGWDEWNGYQKSHEYFDVWKYDENGNKVSVDGYNWEPTWHTDMVLDFARRHSSAGRPWIYYLAYGPPHLPEQCLQKYLDMYDPAEFEFNPDVVAGVPAEKEAELRETTQVYYGQVTALDDEIGRLVAGLKDLGIDDNTIILYTSDHGDRLGSHYEQAGKIRGKSSPYWTAFRIPLIVRWPGHVKGQVCDTLACSVDVVPTLLELAGVKVPSYMQGDSLAEWCLTGKGKDNEAVYFSAAGWRGVWDGRFVYAPVGKFNVMYDHESDPYEMNNIVDSPEYADERKRLGKIMVDFAKRTNDPELGNIREVYRS